MRIIDAQVHPYERNHPGRPWKGDPHGPVPSSATGDELVAMMNRHGVHGSILVSSFNFYRYDASYARSIFAAHPSRFALVKPVDTCAPDVVDTITEWAGTSGTVGIRIILDDHASPDPLDVGINRVLATAAQASLPVNLLCWGRLDQASQLAARNPNTRIVIDHLGLRQPFRPPPPAHPWAELPKVLALARYDNIAIKVSGACTLSHRSYPFDDIWPPVLKVLDAFGLERCMWGTDWTRAIALLTYEQAVNAFRTTDRLSESDKAQLMGLSLTKIYGWSPPHKSCE